MNLFIFGYGFTGQALARRMMARGWSVTATARDADKAAAVASSGATPVDPADRAALVAALAGADAILITSPPGPEGCPGLNTLVPALAKAQAFPDWVGYLSTTGVYGDRQGGWCFETSPLNARSPEAARRVAAERDWLEVGRGMGLTVQVFRLPGIYGPGRSVLDRLRAGEARSLAKPGQVFSRIHVEDIAGALEASLARPRAGAIYNITDDEPAPPQDVTAHGARLLGLAPFAAQPFDESLLSPAAKRFWGENKRVSNARAKAELGWRPLYATYREGLAAVLKAGG